MYEDIFHIACEKVSVVGRLRDASLIDVALVTGSYARGANDEYSDIDLFLVVPLSVQRDHELLPEYTFDLERDGKIKKVEISFVATEKLRIDQTSKSHIFWWHDAICVYARNDELREVFLRASRYTEDEKKDELWTLHFQLKLGTYDYDKTLKRRPDDRVCLDMIYYDCMRIFLQFTLLSSGIVRRFTNYTRELQKIDPDLYEYLNNVMYEASSQRESLGRMGSIIDTSLLGLGFSEQEVAEWWSHNLTRLKFQKY